MIARDGDNEALSYQLDAASIDKGISLDAGGKLSWLPDSGDVGNHQVTITVTDSAGASQQQVFSISVIGDNVAPKVAINPSLSPLYLGQEVSFYVAATDNIGVARIDLTVNGNGVKVNRQGIYTFTPSHAGVVEARALVYDLAGNMGAASFNLEVLDTSDVNAPVIDIPSLPTGVITQPTEIIGTINDDNFDYYKLEIAIAGSNDYLEIFRNENPVINNVLGLIDGTTLANDAYSYRITAVDINGNSAFIEEDFQVEGDLKLGNFQLSFTDLAIPVTGIPISLTRTYDSLTATERDDFGYGWRLEFRDTNLRTSLGMDESYEKFGIPSEGFNYGEKVYLTLPGGKRETFTFTPTPDRLGGFLTTPSGNGGLYHPTFTAQNGSYNTLTVKDVLLTRNAEGEYVGLAGELYNPANATYGGKYWVTTKQGIVYEIDGESGDLLTVTDNNGNKLTYSEAGILSDTGVEVRFNRDAVGRIVEVVDPMGNKIGYEYDSLGDLVGVTDREGNKTSFGYSEERRHYLDEIVDALGRSGVRAEYDENGRLSRMLDVNGEALELVYDVGNSVQTVVDVLGNETIYEYDERGNVLTEIDADGKIVKRSYDENNNQLTERVITDESGAEGWTTSYSYDSQGNVLTETDADGNVIRYRYGNLNRLISETDALGNTTSYTYDNRGNLLATKDAVGNVNKFNYDNRGNLISIVDAANNVSSFSYDTRGNLISLIDANGNKTIYTYNELGNQLTETQTVTTANGLETVVMVNEYDNNNNLIAITDALNYTTRYEYDELGKQVAIIDSLGRKMEYRYDNQGRLVEVIYPDSTPNDLSDNPRTQTEYDALGREIVTIDEAGRITHYVYDSVGRLIETIYPDSTPDDLTDNPRTQTEYYQDGLVKAEIDELGYRTEYIYNDLRQLVTIIYPELGDNPNINYTTNYSYDANGRQISQIDANGNTTRFIYDGLSRQIKTIAADGSYTSNTYDKLGRRIATTDAEGKIIEYEYDNLGRLTDVIQWLNDTEIRTEYEYDELGRLISVEDANNHSTSYEYDLLGRRIAVILPLGQRSSTIYDGVGNVISATDFNGDTITYEYDAQNRLIVKGFPDESEISFTYTITGLRDTVTDSRGTTSYVYDERDRLISYIYPDGKAINYTYNLVGNLTSLTTTSGTVYYSYDEWNRLKTVTDEDDVTSYFYDGVSNLIRTELPNGIRESREYDSLNRLIYLENTNSLDEVISSYEYTLNKVGHRLAVLEADGRLVEYKYDDLYRLIEEKIDDARSFSYTYDSVGNRLAKVDSIEGITSYSYDKNDRLLTEVLVKDGVTVSSSIYTYDDNGNTISEVKNGTEETVYDWDYENRLVKVTLTDGTEISYEYDVDNIRVASIVDGVKTVYLVDKNQAYAQVLEEYVDEELEVRYVYGLDLIEQERATEITFYLVDGLGSTRFLTDENSVVTDSYDYEAFGELIDSFGDSENDYRFAGEQYNEELDQYYLRDRYYDQEIGRFSRRDTFEGRNYYPITLHKYLYANADPVNGIDPSGFATYSEIIAARKIRDTLAKAELTTFEKIVSTGGNPSAFVTELAWELGFELFPLVMDLVEEITNLGQTVNPGKRIELYREALDLTSNRKRSRNFAFADISIGTEKATLLSLSGEHYRPGIVSPYAYPKSHFNPFNTPENHDRTYDSEYKILETVANRYIETPEIKGQIYLHTERPPCPSCAQAIKDFKDLFPNIKLEVNHN